MANGTNTRGSTRSDDEISSLCLKIVTFCRMFPLMSPLVHTHWHVVPVMGKFVACDPTQEI